MNNKKADITKYVFISVFLILLIFSLLIIKPYLNAILGGIVLAIIFYPLHSLIYRKTKKKNLSAMIITIIAILIVFLPILFVFQQVTYQAKVAYVLTKQKLVSGQLIADNLCVDQQNLMCNINDKFKSIVLEPKFAYYRDNALQKIEGFLWELTPNLLMAIPKIIINLFILVFVLFYALRDGESLFRRIGRMLPLKSSHKEKIFAKIKDVNYAIVYGHVITGLVQGAIGTIGFYIFGVTSPLILGIVMTIAALIPFVGASIVWFPIALLKIFDGLAVGDQTIFWKGLGLMLYGIFIVSTIDNIIKPKITADKAKVSPVIILLGLIGGVTLFGIVGIIVGPLVLALTKTFIEIYEKERHEITG